MFQSEDSPTIVRIQQNLLAVSERRPTSRLSCQFQMTEALDGLAVESSGLTQLESPSLYRLQVALRNRDAQVLLAPALDLTLTDNRGEVVARKVLRQADFGANAPPTLAPGTEWSVQVVLDSGERRISGYNIEIFYP